jgi:hypothetical protein
MQFEIMRYLNNKNISFTDRTLSSQIINDKSYNQAIRNIKARKKTRCLDSKFNKQYGDLAEI